MPLQTTLTDITQDVRGVGIAAAVPLTTVWTAPSVCASTFIIDNPDYEICTPPGYSNAWDHGGHYSPGICPYGSTVGCTYVGTTIRLNDNTLRESETAGLCVPSSWLCWEEESSSSGTWQVIEAKFASTTGMNDDIPVGSKAPAWEIRWQSSDLAILETAPLPNLEASTTGDDKSASPTDDDNSAVTVTVISDSGGDGGLSKGAVAGIVVGACVLLAAAIGAIFYWRRSSKSNKTEAATSAEESGQNAAAAMDPYVPPNGVHEKDGHIAAAASPGYMHGENGSRGPGVHEIGQDERHTAELGASQGPDTLGLHELDSSHTPNSSWRSELPH